MKIKSLAVSAVIFDMDGVITHTMPAHARAWKKVLAQEGLGVKDHDIYKREGQRGLTSVQEIFAEFGRPCPAATARRLLRQKERLFKRTVKERYIPGARSFIREIRQREIPMAIATGTSRHECRKILPARLRNLFDVIITGSDVINGKPDPEPYRLALTRLGVTPESALVIENAPLGIRAAKAAGCRCWALSTSLTGDYLKEADKIFNSFRDLQQHVRLTAASKSRKAEKRYS